MDLTVAMQTDCDRGSRASSFSSLLNSFLGGSICCLKQCAGAARLFVSIKYSFQENPFSDAVLLADDELTL